jgi:hypothetical protein
MSSHYEYLAEYLGGNIEFLGKAWKNQGLGLDLSEKTLHSKLHSKI